MCDCRDCKIISHAGQSSVAKGLAQGIGLENHASFHKFLRYGLWYAGATCVGVAHAQRNHKGRVGCDTLAARFMAVKLAIHVTVHWS